MLENKRQSMWILWGLLTVIVSAYFAYSLLESKDKTMFTPGDTSHGHHQIEMSCSTCHGESFTEPETVQKSCVNCHGEQLKEAKDDHPKKKFTDPRNADRIAELDARYCVTCHTEHAPERTQEMGLTLSEDFCFKCHENVAEDRPSHEGMEFNTCASAGCHNYHDNRALYEDFLAKHLHEANISDKATISLKPNLAEVAEMLGQYPIKKFPIKTVNKPDAPEHIAVTEEIEKQWLMTAHADKGVNCTACHQQDPAEKWVEKPSHETCNTCHENETAGFLQGKHGMRLNEEKLGIKFDPMVVSSAKIPMQKRSHAEQLTCSSCHGAHTSDTVFAAVDGCLQCHADDHSTAYKKSPHLTAL